MIDNFVYMRKKWDQECTHWLDRADNKSTGHHLAFTEEHSGIWK